MQVTKVLVLFGLVSSFQNCFGQYKVATVQSFKYHKNTIDVVYGSIGLTSALTTSYQRFLFTNPKVLNPFLRLGYGKQFDSDLGDGEDVAIYLVNAGLVFGLRKHHLECGLGIVNDFMKNKPFTTFLQPSGFVGYRIQNLRSTGPFDFRTGLGCPETLYVGLGLWF